MQLNLQQLVGAIRDELERVDRERESKGRPTLFQLETLDLELKFGVVESSETKAGFDFRVIALGKNVEGAAESVQTIRLQYRVAKDKKGQPLFGARAHSSGSEVPPDCQPDIPE